MSLFWAASYTPLSFLHSWFFVAYPMLFHSHLEHHLYCQCVGIIQLLLVFRNPLNLQPSQMYPVHATIPTITLVNLSNVYPSWYKWEGIFKYEILVHENNG
ncbi:hypothetical protein B0H10DRAFT_1957450 [Mycena sp. CBHHK59/15]|nr:hypothetical protein B0H10DRAFT_1957450 [Mycena sp. CBHHK59/15]